MIDYLTKKIIEFWIDRVKMSKTDFLVLLTFLLLLFHFFNDDIKRFNSTKKNERGQIIKPDRLGRKLTKTDELQYRLDEMRYMYKCDRVNINLFHNGDSTKNGWHFDKMSCEAESKADTLASNTIRLVNFRIQPFYKKFLKLMYDEFVYIPDLKNDSDPYFRNRLPLYGVRSVVYVALYDDNLYDPITKKSHLAGFIAFQWSLPTNLSSSTIESMKKDRYNIYQYIILNKEL